MRIVSTSIIMLQVNYLLNRNDARLGDFRIGLAFYAGNFPSERQQRRHRYRLTAISGLSLVDFL